MSDARMEVDEPRLRYQEEVQDDDVPIVESTDQVFR